MNEDIPIQSVELDLNHDSYESVCKEETLESIDLNNFFLENDNNELDLFTTENNELDFSDFSDFSEMLI